MTQEKRGVIEPGRTPPESEEKAASTEQLADHVTSRLAEAAKDSISGNGNSDEDR